MSTTARKNRKRTRRTLLEAGMTGVAEQYRFQHPAKSVTPRAKRAGMDDQAYANWRHRWNLARPEAKTPLMERIGRAAARAIGRG
ncbi:hypothetical protein [Frigoribacterium sp. VKM Ac-2530]|uniref:hypothetical protein n=1 Tax=Frigoribacterium sp. VKM Ac-2530 TaxID=2783822 RepID=UPI00188C2330|nr:hypothetical protein [Frigoribacterium sp. VKM Ac-2530]MBF4578915.1 hypothetical protein [Frigoribacterium sp. VKM Ac-2530]